MRQEIGAKYPDLELQDFDKKDPDERDAEPEEHDDEDRLGGADLR